MTEPRFIHLRTRSAYSLLEGAIHVKALATLAAEAGMPALGLADTNNLFGALEFAETCVKAGVQPVMGATLSVMYAPPAPGDRLGPIAPMAFYARDAEGWRNLMALASAAHLDPRRGEPAHVTLDAVEARAAGLVCLTGGAEGPLGTLALGGREGEADALAVRLARGFGDRLYVELHRHGTAEEAETEPALLDIAYGRGLPVVAANLVHFEKPEQFTAHDALICIGESRVVNETGRRQLTPEHHFRSADAMAKRFADLPEALANTVEIARRCAVRPRTHPPILPKFAEDEVEELRRQAREGLEARLAVIPHAAPVADYEARLDYELSVIEQMGFPGYFLIVADFIKWAKGQGIPVGPGRGSGAGSLVAYALTITDLDPLRYGLLFERFLNPERVSMPDFDIDFCQDRREEVIEYVARTYGRDRVAQIITFGALLSKAAVRDVARVLQLPFAVGDRLSKLIPVEGVKPVSIGKARREEPRLEEEARKSETVAALLDIAEAIEGLYRNASTHAAGVVIGDRPLVELVPLYRDPKSEMPATQYNMKWVEPAGLVKFDFLGLKTLTVIQNAVDLIALREAPPDMAHIPLDDAETYALYARADTVGVFQVESAGMRDALRQLRPTCIEDIVALVALYRPGPMENIPTYCNVKNGREERASIHPLIDPILDETQGIIVYQEQVMEIARRMAGYSLGGADLLRRAMGKKIKEAMDAERPKFLKGAAANDVPEAKALEVWNLLEKFANYGFNKSHAAAYALVSYQTAWLKANHPVEFMAAVMNLDIHLTDKLTGYVQECRRMGIAVVAPCVNRSRARFTVEGGEILYALGGLKNVGLEAMRLFVEAREAGGPFASLADVAARVDLKAVGKRALEMLARAGAFDALEPNRRRVFASLDRLIEHSAAAHEDRTSAQGSLLGQAALPPPRLAPVDDWLPSERLSEEHAAVGFFLSGHPLDDHADALRRRGVLTHAEFLARRATSGRIAGTLGAIQNRKSARGTRFAFLSFSDRSGGYEAMAFADVLVAAEEILTVGANLVLTVDADEGSDVPRLMLRSVQRVEELTATALPDGLRVHLADPAAAPTVAKRLEAGAKLARAKGTGPVHIVLRLEDRAEEVEIALPGRWPVTPEMKGALKAAPGVAHVEEL